MRQTIAEQFAAAEIGLTPDDVRKMLVAFLQAIAICPSCEDEGTLTFAKGMTLPVSGGGGFGTHIAPGTTGSCPRCGGLDAEDNPSHDPDYVEWHCREGYTQYDCQHARGDQEREDRRAAHARCGYRVMLPLPE